MIGTSTLAAFIIGFGFGAVALFIYLKATKKI